jgi:hypothetical protein
MLQSRDSSVGIGLGYRLDDRGSRVRFPAGLFTTVSRTALGPTQPPIKWVSGALSLGVKRPRREADHSPPLSVRSKNAWSYTSTPQYVFMAWCLVKHRDNFTFTFNFKGHVASIVTVTEVLVKIFISTNLFASQIRKSDRKSNKKYLLQFINYNFKIHTLLKETWNLWITFLYSVVYPFW